VIVTKGSAKMTLAVSNDEVNQIVTSMRDGANTLEYRARVIFKSGDSFSRVKSIKSIGPLKLVSSNNGSLTYMDDAKTLVSNCIS
jgi:hypothetical protein